MTVPVHVTSVHCTDTLLSFLTPLFVRIAGDTALDKNIHESVSAQIKKNFAKSKWKVSPISSFSWMHFDFLTYMIYIMWFISPQSTRREYRLATLRGLVLV